MARPLLALVLLLSACASPAATPTPSTEPTPSPTARPTPTPTPTPEPSPTLNAEELLAVACDVVDGSYDALVVFDDFEDYAYWHARLGLTLLFDWDTKWKPQLTSARFWIFRGRAQIGANSELSAVWAAASNVASGLGSQVLSWDTALIGPISFDDPELAGAVVAYGDLREAALAEGLACDTLAKEFPYSGHSWGQ